MAIESCFLSLDEGLPLGVWWADSFGCGVIPLHEFLAESKMDMSKEQAERYAAAFREFANELDESTHAPD